MSNFYTRLQLEQSELASKIESLDSFMKSSMFLDISKPQQNLLQIQILAMKTYLQILNQRLENLNQ